jgi:hypothetical protein
VFLDLDYITNQFVAEVVLGRYFVVTAERLTQCTQTMWPCRPIWVNVSLQKSLISC